MTENNWTFTGIVKKFKDRRGTEGGQEANWGSMWILVQMNPIFGQVGNNPYRVDNNQLFIDVRLDYTDQSTKRLLNIAEGDNILIRSAKIDQIKKSRKNDKDEWEKYLETGIKSYPKDINIYTRQLAPVNYGIVSGKVVKQVGSKIIVQDKYMSPKEKTWKTRDIPVLLEDAANSTNVENKYIYAICRLAGKNDKGESKVYGITDCMFII